jgi:hypothetical protein
MVTYEFYWLDPIKGYHRIGVLPERRRNPERITQATIIKWGEKFFGKKLGLKDIFFMEVTVDENLGKIYRPTSFLTTQQKI